VAQQAVPLEMIDLFQNIEIPLIVGGGIVDLLGINTRFWLTWWL
jgi:putative glycerol-1-phosphate prenyltransferase